MFSLIFVWINGWVNNREAGDMRRYRAHFDVIVVIVINWDKMRSIDGVQVQWSEGHNQSILSVGSQLKRTFILTLMKCFSISRPEEHRWRIHSSFVNIVFGIGLDYYRIFARNIQVLNRKVHQNKGDYIQYFTFWWFMSLNHIINWYPLNQGHLFSLAERMLIRGYRIATIMNKQSLNHG